MKASQNMDIIIGDSPETDVQLLAPAILGGTEQESLIEAFREAQTKCYEDGIAAIFVPYGDDQLAIVETGPEKAKIMAVR